MSSFIDGTCSTTASTWAQDPKLLIKIPFCCSTRVLTLMSLLWCFILLMSATVFFVTEESRYYLYFCQSLCIIGHYITDSLDGAVGRFRKEGYIRWSYHVDHSLDALYVCCLTTSVFWKQNENYYYYYHFMIATMIATPMIFICHYLADTVNLTYKQKVSYQTSVMSIPAYWFERGWAIFFFISGIIGLSRKSVCLFYGTIICLIFVIYFIHTSTKFAQLDRKNNKQKLLLHSNNDLNPTRIAFSMDGNRRWSKEEGLPNIYEGYKEGAKRAIDVTTWCHELGLKEVTLWALSVKNLTRSREEIDGVVKLLVEIFRSDSLTFKHLMNMQTKIIFIGEWIKCMEEQYPEMIRVFKEAQSLTHHNTGIKMAVAVAYDGKREIVEIFRVCSNSTPSVGEMNDNTYLAKAGMGPPHLIIRTGGAKRISDFMNWDGGDSELIFIKTKWPGISKDIILNALEEYRLQRVPTTGERDENKKQ